MTKAAKTPVDGPESSSTAAAWPALPVRCVAQALDVCDWHVNHEAHVVYRDLKLRRSLVQASSVMPTRYGQTLPY
jgi:hypothetical protein